jgi:hypothetical protein
MMYDTTSLDEIAIIGFVLSLVVYLAIKGDLFRGW